jgi:phosphatidylserine decarboxylase
MSRLTDRLAVMAQHVLPQHSLCRLIYAATRVRTPWWKNALIRWFVRHYRVDMDSCREVDPTRYEHFNSFFTRALKPGARPLPSEVDAVACPVDGVLSQAGDIVEGTLMQAKGRTYRLEQLLGGSEGGSGNGSGNRSGDRSGERAALFANGHYATLYLAPRDYHRVHMPLGGQLREMMYVPGRLFSVNAASTRAVHDLFGRNERVITVFDTPAGPMGLVLIGALFVASIETVWAGAVTPSRAAGRRTRRWDYTTARIVLERGGEMGRFNMGSTVIVLFSAGRVKWEPHLSPGQSVTMGQQLGRYY